MTKDGVEKIQQEMEMEEEVSLMIPNELVIDGIDCVSFSYGQ